MLVDGGQQKPRWGYQRGLFRGGGQVMSPILFRVLGLTAVIVLAVPVDRSFVKLASMLGDRIVDGVEHLVFLSFRSRHAYIITQLRRFAIVVSGESQ